MLVIFTGDDVVRAKQESIARADGAEIVRVGEGMVPFADALGYVGQGGMFTKRVVLIIDRPLDSEDGKDFLFEHGDLIAQSDTLAIAIAPTLNAEAKKKLPKSAKVETFEIKKKYEPAFTQNSFALLDALQAGDRKGMWVTYRSLLASGSEPEELHGTLAWGLRGMVLAGKVKTADEAGMKEYPFKKAQVATARLGQAKVEELSQSLVDIYHSARAGKGQLEDLLEVFLLKKS